MKNMLHDYRNGLNLVDLLEYEITPGSGTDRTLAQFRYLRSKLPIAEQLLLADKLTMRVKTEI